MASKAYNKEVAGKFEDIASTLKFVQTALASPEDRQKMIEDWQITPEQALANIIQITEHHARTYNNAA